MAYISFDSCLKKFVELLSEAHLFSADPWLSFKRSPATFTRSEFAELVDELIDWQSRVPDAADKLLDVICRMDKAPAQVTNRREGDLFYMPTHVRQIEAAIQAGFLDKNDTFVDVGCGPGARLPVYVQLRTGAQTAGIEKYDMYFNHAQNTVNKLSLENKVEIVHCDALEYDYRQGSVFYLLRPVEGRKLVMLLDKLADLRRKEKALILTSGGTERTFFKHSAYEPASDLTPGGLYAFKTL